MKTFDPSNSINPPTEYGKVVFTERVVAPKANSIEFSGDSLTFALLLTGCLPAECGNLIALLLGGWVRQSSPHRYFALLPACAPSRRPGGGPTRGLRCR